MRRMCIGAMVCAAILLSGSGSVTASATVAIAGNVGLGIAYVPVPPASYDVASDLTLELLISGFTFVSSTGFDIYGFRSQRLGLAVDLGVVGISEEIRFGPHFTRNEIRVSVSMEGVSVGLDLILADVSGPPAITYSMGGVLDVTAALGWGLSLTSLTGFGAQDLVHRLGGVTAPFRTTLLSGIHEVGLFCEPAPTRDVTIVPGFFFEEQLLRMVAGRVGLITSTTVWLDDTGLKGSVSELGYRFDDPAVAFLAVLELSGWMTIAQLDFVLDLMMDGIRFSSHTLFVELPPPSIAPIVFEQQSFGVSFCVSPFWIRSATVFDAAFFFAEQWIELDVQLKPARIRSLTVLDGMGFSRQCVRVDVHVLGARLHAEIAFSFAEILRAAVGFDLPF